MGSASHINGGLTRSRRPDIPSGLAAVIDRSLASEPEQRIAGAEDMSRALLPFR